MIPKNQILKQILKHQKKDRNSPCFSVNEIPGPFLTFFSYIVHSITKKHKHQINN